MLELPGLHDAANEASVSAKRWYLRLTLFSLLALTVAAVAGAVGGTGPAVAALLLFVLALFLRIYHATERPERAWYDGRAMAESVKTLAWRYAVGGHPFSIALPPEEVDLRYVHAVQGLLGSLRGTYLGRHHAISDGMQAARQTTLDERRNLYLAGRIDDQAGWYAMRAASHQRRYQLWGRATLVFEFAGIAGGVVILATEIDFEVLGIFAAAAAAAIAWVETNQYGNLAHSYSNAAQELATIRTLAPHVASEEAWANFVATAEEAISREHVTWAAAGGTATTELRALVGGRLTMYISYRRADTEAVGLRLYEVLRGHFSEHRVFTDIDHLARGDRLEATRKAMGSFGVVLVVIGPGWLSATDDRGTRRLDNPDDVVRFELETVLEQNAHVIPVLIDDAVMPRQDELPSSLRPIAGRHAFGLRVDSWGRDVEALIATLHRLDEAAAGIAWNEITPLGAEETG